MYRIAIVDDEAEIRLRVHRQVENVSAALQVQYEIVEFPTAESLLFETAEGKGFDLFLLDVELGDMNGLELAGIIRNKFPESYLIFITYYSKYAIQGYTCKAYRYLLKEKLEEQLEEVLRNVYDEMDQVRQRYYLITTNARYVKIPCREILYIEKREKYAVIHTERGEDSVRKTLAQVFEELPVREFVFIERRYIANIRHVMRYQDNEVILRNGIVLPVSRPQSRNVRQCICEYWRHNI